MIRGGADVIIIEIKCTINVMHLNHPETIPPPLVHRKLVFHEKGVCVHSVLSDSVTPWTVAHQAPLSVGFFRQEYWSGLPCPTPGNLPYPGTEPMSLASPALAGRFFTTGTTWEAPGNRSLVPKRLGATGLPSDRDLDHPLLLAQP